MSIKRLAAHLAPVDFISIVFLTFLICLNIIFWGKVREWIEIIVINLSVIFFIVFLAYIAETTKNRLYIILHRFYSYLIIIFVFKEIYLMVRPINPVDYDYFLIAVDKWMFGVNPTEWLEKFAHPLLTEILQIAYFSYYFLFIILGIEIYRRYPIEEFDKSAFIVVYGFYLSYMGYFILPAVGPRFTLHNFYLINDELPGVFFTRWIRDFINAGESISFNMPNAIEIVQRDVFPSGHTQLTIVVMYMARKYKLKTRLLLTILGVLLIISTVYLRYHYVIDILAGIVFFVLTVWTGRMVSDWWDRKKIEFNSTS